MAYCSQGTTCIADKPTRSLFGVCGCLLCGVCVQPLIVGVVCGQRACKQAGLYADNVVFEVGITKGYLGQW